jgi:hypothetical protein
MVITGSLSIIDQDIEIEPEQTGLKRFALRWTNLDLAMHGFLSRQFSNFIILGLALILALPL